MKEKIHYKFLKRLKFIFKAFELKQLRFIFKSKINKNLNHLSPHLLSFIKTSY